MKRSVSSIRLTLFLALQIAGCGQTAGQDKAAQKAERAQGTEKEGAGAEKSSAEAEKSGSRTGEAGREQSTGSSQADAKAAANQGDGVIEFKPGMPIREGVAAPDLIGEPMDGISITLSELQGKPIIINSWAAWCGPCVKEVPAFERLKDDFGDKIDIITVSCGDGAGTVRDFIGGNGYAFPAVLDEEYSISTLYPANSVPYTMVLGTEDKVTRISIGALDTDAMYERYKEALGV